MFLTRQDLSASLYPEIAGAIANYSETIIRMQLARAEGEIETYLANRYLIRPELEKVGEARHEFLLGLARDLAIYHLYALQETIPEHREKRYDQAIAILRLIQKGESALPGVPMVPTELPAEGAGAIAWGSGKKRVQLSDVL
ncbi:phage protein Gp36 family protein [Fibrella sp. WM1]|uniref:phage protein Gp36 family protein n=1 Tax=Fibrella musci TaxID=3242485 RepID=UPI00352123E3